MNKILPLVLSAAFLGGSFGLSPVYAAPEGTVLSQELDNSSYDCSFTLAPAATLKSSAVVQVSLDWQNAQNFTRVTVNRSRALLEAIHDGASRKIGEAPLHFVQGSPAALTVMRRGETLALEVDGALLFRATSPRPGCSEAAISADAGWGMANPRIQKLEPVTFSDDFMRTADEPGDWTKQAGQWRLQSAWDDDPHGNANRFTNSASGQNPFAWLGSNPTGSALCSAGRKFWEDYTLTTALCPPDQGAGGVVVNMTGPSTGLLVRWSPANDRSTHGNQLGLYHLLNGKTLLIKEITGGYVPGQWYRLAVKSTWDGVDVSVDGQLRLSARGVAPIRGAVGLYAEGSRGAIFDDVSVYGRTLNTAVDDTTVVSLGTKIQEDAGMNQWLDKTKEWLDLTSSTGSHVYRSNLYGSQTLVVNVKPIGVTPGRLVLAVGTDGQTADSGLHADVKPDDTGAYFATLYRGAHELAKDPLTLSTPAKPFTARLTYCDRCLKLDLNGQTAADAEDVDAPEGLKPMYTGKGAFSPTWGAMATGSNVLDTDFSHAPVDWYTEGTWKSTVRWACSPEWSFLAGWSRGDAVLWHKQTFGGDQEFDAFVGIKMEYPREDQMYHQRYRDMAITLCGNGTDPRSGYAGIYGAAAKDGTPNQRAVLLRNGVEVASVDSVVPGYTTNHRHWFHLQLVKHGATIEFRADDRLLAQFVDPQPINVGSPAIWSHNNGISVARARIQFAGKTELRSDPRVIINEPAYPEWADVGAQLPLDFSRTWSTSGKPVTLNVVDHDSPGGESAVTIRGSEAIFSPRTVGESWYEVRATDGISRSEAFHLNVNAFDPSIGRDDSGAVVLYRFNEGSGAVVHDVSGKLPAADLKVTNPNAVQWLPGRGLQVHGPDGWLASAAPVDKLGDIAKTKACTLEFWLSTDTVYPPTHGWQGSLLAWQAPGDCPNLAVGHQSLMLGILLHKDADAWDRGRSFGDPALESDESLLTGLHHWAITWDGTTTSFYRDGQLLVSRVGVWSPETWTNNARLFLGNLEAGDRGYVGTYYLAAIHDRCLTAEQVLRHFKAGPDGKELSSIPGKNLQAKL